MAISLLAVWRAARDDGRDDVVARRLAAVASEGGLTAVEKAALGPADVAGMLLELYADCAGTSLDAVLEEAAAALADSEDSSG
jgi:hypothetical protein